MRVMNDLITADLGVCSILFLLDLIAAFDIKCHSVLLGMLQNGTGLALNWFQSYLSDHS